MILYKAPDGGGGGGLRLSDLPPGAVVKIEEDGVMRDFKVAQHDYIELGVTAIERELCLAQTVAFNAAGVNTYEGGTLDVFLTTTYRGMLEERVRDALVEVEIPVTPGNGDYNVTTIMRDVFVFSGTEVGLENQYMVVEGSKVDIYTDNTSRIKYSDDAPTTARYRWTRSAHINNVTDAWNVYILGTVGQTRSPTEFHISPALTLPSTIKVHPTPNPDGTYNLKL